MEVVSNRDKKRARPRFIVGVGGVEGLLLLGGSLAIAGLMALFTIKTTSTSKSKSSQVSVDSDDNIIEETICIDNNDGLENSGFSSGKKEGLEFVLDQEELLGCNDTNGGSNADLSSQVSTVDQANEEGKGVVIEAEKQGKGDEEEEEAECQHEILVLSDDSTPPESIVSCDDYTESTDLSLGEEDEDDDEQKVGEKEAYEQGEVEGGDSKNYESSEEEEDDSEEEEEEVTECSSSLSSLVMEEAAPIYVKEFADFDPNYESIAKELNSFNCLGLGQKKLDTSSGLFGSGTHLRPLVGANEVVAVAGPPPLTKARLWLMLVPVVMLTMFLAMIHFIVVDNYVMDMEF